VNLLDRSRTDIAIMCIAFLGLVIVFLWVALGR
jgi:hypothetical protein